MVAAEYPLIPALIGPTAVGKSALGLTMAERLGGEIVSADSRQVYRDLTIGTAKPTEDELARVPHHFIGELDLSEPFSAGQFAEEATHRIRDILSRSKVPILVGGSTLYIEALLHGLAEIPETSETTRARLNHRLETEGPEVLFDELRDVDPIIASTMDVTKTQRIVRALEVFEDTGHPLSYFHETQPEPPFRFCTFVLGRPREELYDRINRRVDSMIEAGLIEEVRALLDSGFTRALNPLRTIGYREPIALLRGETDWETTVRLMKRNTRRYAKRQLTWFRRRDTYRWVDARDSETVLASVSSEIII